MTETILFQRATFALTQGQLTTVPPTGGGNVPQNTYRAIKIVMGLSDADKLAVGKTLDLSAFLSPDNGANWNFINGIHWVSYGPAGLTVKDPDGTVRVNPDPTLGVPLNNITAQELARLTYLSTGIATASVAIIGIS